MGEYGMVTSLALNKLEEKFRPQKNAFANLVNVTKNFQVVCCLVSL